MGNGKFEFEVESEAWVLHVSGKTGSPVFCREEEEEEEEIDAKGRGIRGEGEGFRAGLLLLIVWVHRRGKGER